MKKSIGSKVRVDWLKKGNKKTKYFYYKESSRKRKNKILGVKDKNGNWMIKREDVESEFCKQFTNLFTTLIQVKVKWKQFFSGIVPRASA